jgi:hypothetical protein
MARPRIGMTSGCKVGCCSQAPAGDRVLPARRYADVAVDNLTRWDFTEKAAFTSHPRFTFAASAATLEHPHSLGIIRRLTRLLPHRGSLADHRPMAKADFHTKPQDPAVSPTDEVNHEPK